MSHVVFPWVSIDCLELSFREPAPCEEQSLIKEAKAFPFIQTLFQEAQEASQKERQVPLRIYAVHPGSIPREGRVLFSPIHNAMEIWIKSTLRREKALGVLIYELINVKGISRLEDVHRKASQGDMSKEEFVREKEAGEYGGSFLYNTLLQLGKSLDSKFWKGVELAPFTSLEQYLIMQNSNGHSEVIQKQWDECFSEAYKRKHLD